MSHARLYSSESYNERDDKSADANTFNRSCGDGGSSYSLSAIIVSVSSTSDVGRFWIFTSYLFIPNDPIPSDDVVDWDNDSMLMKGSLCYKTGDNYEVTLQHAVVFMPVSIYTHPQCIHTYCDF